MKKRLLVLALVCVLLISGILYSLKYISSNTVLASFIYEKLPTIVIDAGHGGIDGGAVGADGTVEKGINLTISKYLKTQMELFGFKVIMTRTNDELIGDSSLSTVREKKRSDILKRLSILEDENNAVLLSVHQNKFPNSKYSGAQVFYSKNNSESALLADEIQKSFVELLQKDNVRQIKPSGSEIYLLNNATKPAVMVECGFMSNVDELEKLKNDDYKMKIAFTIACGVMNYCALEIKE